MFVIAPIKEEVAGHKTTRCAFRVVKADKLHPIIFL
jgi:hypothetical protein